METTNNEYTSRPFLGFDIETAPDEQAAVRLYRPPPPFDPAAVKLGNIKDPILKREKIEAARVAHETETANGLKNAIERAALSALTGRLVAIGYTNPIASIEIETVREFEEKELLVRFWRRFSAEGDAGTRFVFWSGSGASDSNFDLDFMFQRSLILGVRIPPQARPLGARYFSDRLVDLASRFLLGKREAFLSLTAAADVFGLYDRDIRLPGGFSCRLARKSANPTDQEVSGATFHRFLADPASRELALDYLKNDLRHVAALAPRVLQ